MRTRLTRLAGEFSVIVVSVLVALAADGWWEEQGREERAQATADLLLVDLAADSAAFARLARFPLAHDSLRAIIWATPPEADLPSDSVVTLLRRLVIMAPYAPTRAAFESLVASDGVRFVGGDSLQVEIVQYYERFQADVTWWYGWFTEENRVLYDLLREVQVPAPSSVEEGMQPWTRVPQRLASSWPGVRGNEVLMSQLWYNQIYEQNLGDMVARAVEANASLVSALRRARAE